MLAGKGKVQSYRLLLSNRATKHYQFCTPREALFIMPPGRDNGPTSCLLFFVIIIIPARQRPRGNGFLRNFLRAKSARLETIRDAGKKMSPLRETQKPRRSCFSRDARTLWNVSVNCWPWASTTPLLLSLQSLTEDRSATAISFRRTSHGFIIELANRGARDLPEETRWNSHFIHFKPIPAHSFNPIKSNSRTTAAWNATMHGRENKTKNTMRAHTGWKYSRPANNTTTTYNHISYY